MGDPNQQIQKNEQKGTKQKTKKPQNFTLYFFGIFGSFVYMIYQLGTLNNPLYPQEKLQLQIKDTQKIYKILIPLPNLGFDPTEAAIPWYELNKHPQFEVIFATEQGDTSLGCDPYLIGGNFLNTQAFGPTSETLQKYKQMINSEEYKNPISWDLISTDNFDSVFLVGGHHPGMNQMLNSQILQDKLIDFKQQNKIIGAVCHGILLLSRTPQLLTTDTYITSVPKYLEKVGNFFTTYIFGMDSYFENGIGYQLSTTNQQYMYDELKKQDFDVKIGPVDYFAALFPSREGNLSHGFIVEDGIFLTGRFWADAYLLVRRYMAKITEQN